MYIGRFRYICIYIDTPTDAKRFGIGFVTPFTNFSSFTHTHAVAISQTVRLTRISGLKLIKKFSGHATSWRLAVTHENCAVAATAAATAAPVAAAADDDVAVVASIDRIYDCHWKCWNYESPSECVCACDFDGECEYSYTNTHMNMNGIHGDGLFFVRQRKFIENMLPAANKWNINSNTTHTHT